MLRVITYHRIAGPSDAPDLDPSLVSATPDGFRKQMMHLKRWYRPVSLEEIAHAFDTGRPLPSRSVHVTIDDAYRDFRDVAWPILAELDIPVTAFIPTAYPDRADRAFWWDRLHRAGANGSGRLWEDAIHEAARDRRLSLPAGPGGPDMRSLLRLLPHDAAESLVEQACTEIDGSYGRNGGTQVMSPVLGWDDLRDLQAEGVTFGTHTRHHVALPRVDAERARAEIRRSLDDLTRELGEAPRAIAYPYGMCNDAVARITAEEGCVLGFTGEDGLNRPDRTDRFRLCRSNITLRTSPPVFTIRMLPWCASIDRWRHRRERTMLIS